MPRLRRLAVALAIILVGLGGAYALDLTPTLQEVDAAMAWVRFAATPSVGAPRPVPRWKHVYLVMFENRECHEIVGAPDAPFMNALATQGAVATNTYDVAEDSQPNYLALTSGDTHFVTNNHSRDVDAPSIFDQLEASSQSWRVFAEHVPPDCFKGATATGGRDGPGEYWRAHEPAISYTRISGSPERCANIQDFAAFDPTAATFEMIIPDLCNMTHDCPVATGDAWLSAFAPTILETPTFWQDSLLVVAFDEGGAVRPGDGHRIATILVGAGVRPGTVSEVRYDHYNVLRTIQKGLGLPCLARSCKADTMADLFAP